MYVGFLSMLSDADMIYTKIKEKICTLEILRSEDFESAYGFHKGGIII